MHVLVTQASITIELSEGRCEWVRAYVIVFAFEEMLAGGCSQDEYKGNPQAPEQCYTESAMRGNRRRGE